MSYNSPELPTGAFITVGLVAAATVEAGTLVARNAAGNLLPAADAAGLTVLGRAEADVDNSAGLVDALTGLVKRGCFRFDNSSSDAVDKASIGKLCYVEDEITVTDVPGTNSIVAGIVVGIETDGVFVDTTQNAALQLAVNNALAIAAAHP